MEIGDLCIFQRDCWGMNEPYPEELSSPRRPTRCISEGEFALVIDWKRSDRKVLMENGEVHWVWSHDLKVFQDKEGKHANRVSF